MKELESKSQSKKSSNKIVSEDEHRKILQAFLKRAQEYESQRNEKQEVKRIKKDLEELDECSFTPDLQHTSSMNVDIRVKKQLTASKFASSGMKYVDADESEKKSIYTRNIMQKNRVRQEIEFTQAKNIVDEFKNCTFKPKNYNRS